MRDKALNRLAWITILIVLTISAVITSKSHCSEVTPNPFVANLARPVEFVPGDTITLPNQFGTFIMLGGTPQPFWFDTSTRWFVDHPVRNFTTVRVAVPFNIDNFEGFFLEYYIKPGGDPLRVPDLRWVQEYRFKINACNPNGYVICY